MNSGFSATRILVAEGVDARVGGRGVLVVFCGEGAFEERDRGHVLEAVVAVSRVRERTGFVDDAGARFLGLDVDAVDFSEPVFHRGVKLDAGFHGGLRVKLGWEGDLEKHVFHHVSAERAA